MDALMSTYQDFFNRNSVPVFLDLYNDQRYADDTRGANHAYDDPLQVFFCPRGRSLRLLSFIRTDLLGRRGIDPMAAHKKPVCVDAIRRAGQ